MILSVTNGRIVAAGAVLSAAEIVVEDGLVVAVHSPGNSASCDAELDLAGDGCCPD